MKVWCLSGILFKKGRAASFLIAFSFLLLRMETEQLELELQQLGYEIIHKGWKCSKTEASGPDTALLHPGIFFFFLNEREKH